jgi:pimeloyl-ACP methyl ester carboxylesterase
LLIGGPVADLLAAWPQIFAHLRTLHASPADREALGRPEIRQVFDGTIRDAMGGGALGALGDLTLYTQDWRIPFDCMQLPMDLWHGELDGTVPVGHTRWYQAHLPSARAHYLPGEGHFSLPLHLGGRILRALMETAHDSADPVATRLGTSTIGL